MKVLALFMVVFILLSCTIDIMLPDAPQTLLDTLKDINRSCRVCTATKLVRCSSNPDSPRYTLLCTVCAEYKTMPGINCGP